MSTNTQMTVETIDPLRAERMLQLNTTNRPLSRNHVNRLAGEMKENRWQFNGDAIRISDHNRLIDGQHRLAAVVKSGVPIQTFVVRGLPDEAFKTIDTGRLRSGADTLALLKQPSPARLAAALRFVEAVTSGSVGHRSKVSNAQLVDLLAKFPGIAQDVDATMQDGAKLMPFGIMAGLRYLFRQKDEKQAVDFFAHLVKGDNLSADSPVYVLRERLVANAASKSRLRGEHLAAFAIKAWNALRAGKELKQLAWRREGKNPEALPDIK